ncbi:metal-sensitive transcriptional regulator [Limisalsivibrio acetivorans]|uniref:metal-sensitive transcriptional regulator n=1 Tax=Limisalsivibrio acetivorans TaxID=1304888 RepID=UPI0003B461BE|nr:metal-sensitive transcriptional regulator [Limisalsivibrio acetivorans]
MKHENTLARLKKAHGQLGGIIRMVEDESYCIDIVNQIAAVRGALDSSALIILENHINSCVKRSMEEGDSSEIVEELMKTLKKYVK